MIKQETVTIGTRQFIHTWSDAGMFIMQNETQTEYEDAMDSTDAVHTYTETEHLIPSEPTDAEYIEAAKIMMGEV